MKKLPPKTINAICLALLAVGALIGVGGALSEMYVIVAIGMGIIVCAMIFRVIFYRCPHCGRYLDRSTGKYCPYCGKPVN